MKIRKSILGSLLLYVLIAAGCGKSTHKYMYDQNFSKDEFPRKIYIAEQVNPLNSEGIVPEKKQPFVEITRWNGNQEVGKLKAIREEEIVLVMGYFFNEKKHTTVRKDVEKKIPKKDILLLKIW